MDRNHSLQNCIYIYIEREREREVGRRPILIISLFFLLRLYFRKLKSELLKAKILFVFV